MSNSSFKRRIPAIVVAAALALLIPGAAGAAEPDPERNLSTPTGWWWWKNRTSAQLEDIESSKGARVIDVEVESSSPPRFGAAMVRNEGSYQREGDWFFDKTRDQVVALTKDKGRRLIDIEPYVHGGGLRFAGVTVPNEGQTAKFWWWNYDLTPGQVTADINKHKIRLIDLDVYKRDGKRRYAYVGIRNEGVDARAWWWYYNVSPAFVQEKAEEHGARLIDIERHKKGRLTVVMVRNDENVYTRHAAGFTQSDLSRLVASNAVRITDIERYGDRYAAVMIDNAKPETARLRSIALASRYGKGYFGVFSRRAGGQTYVGLAHTSPYQPASVLKLLPHLYVMDLLDQGKEPDLDDSSSVTWTSPKGKLDEITCPGQAGDTQSNSTSLRDTLSRGLGESLGRAHESLLNKYDPAEITKHLQDQMGLKSTELYYGCKHPGMEDWLSNRSTLADLGRLFEGVETKAFFTKSWASTRQTFYGLMAMWPIDWWRPVVEDEAAKQGKSGVVEAFMSYLQVHGKGGGADGWDDGAKSWNTTRALSYRLLLPFRSPAQTGPVVNRSFVGGFFVNDLKTPCVEGDAYEKPDEVSEECKQYAKEMAEAFQGLPAESMRIPIREALETWPASGARSSGDTISSPPASGTPSEPASSEPPQREPAPWQPGSRRRG